LVYEEILLYHFPDFKKHYMENIKNNKSVINHIVSNSNKDIKDPADFLKEDLEEENWIKN